MSRWSANGGTSGYGRSPPADERSAGRCLNGRRTREPRVYLAATYDTKGEEAAYVLDVLARWYRW